MRAVKHLLPRAAYTAPVWAAAIRLGVLFALVCTGAAVASATPRRVRHGSNAARVAREGSDRRARMAAMGGGVMVSGLLWGVALGVALTRRVRRAYADPAREAHGEGALRDVDGVVLAWQLAGRQGVRGVLATSASGLRFVPSRDEPGFAPCDVAWSAVREVRAVAIEGRGMASLLGAPSSGVELAIEPGSTLRFAVHRARTVADALRARCSDAVDPTSPGAAARPSP